MARLLIVDDEKNIRANLASFFESLGHEAETVESGRQARAMISSGPAQAVLPPAHDRGRQRRRTADHLQALALRGEVDLLTDDAVSRSVSMMSIASTAQS